MLVHMLVEMMKVLSGTWDFWFVQNNNIIKCYLCKWLGERQLLVSDRAFSEIRL